MEHLVLAALIGHASGASFDGDIDVAGTGSAAQIDVAYRVHRFVSIGGFVGRAVYADGDVIDPIDDRMFGVQERLHDVGVRAAAHVGPCFVAAGIGREIGSWSGALSLRELELGCTYEHVEVAYLATRARGSGWRSETELSTTRLLVGVSF